MTLRQATPTRGVVLSAVVATLALWGALAVVRYLPTHDGPHHIFLAHLENHYSDPGSSYPSFYVPSRALSALGFSLLFAPLDDLLGWRPALLFTLALIVTLWAWGVSFLAWAVDRRRVVLGAVGFATAFQWAVYMGLFSYVLSTAVGLFTLGLGFAIDPWRPRHRVGLAALLFVQAVFHVFAAQVVGLVLVLLVLFRFARREWPRQLGLLALMGAPTLYVAAYAAGWIGSQTAAMPSYLTEPYFLPVSMRFRLLADAFAAGPGWRAWPVVVLGVAGLVIGARRALAGRASAPEKALLVAGGLLLGIALLAPFSMRTWEFLSPRFIPMALIFGVMLLPAEALPERLKHGAGAALVAFALLAIVWAGRHNRRLERACSGALAGLYAPIERTGPRLPIVLDSDCSRLSDEKPFPVRYAEPAWNIGLLYAVEQGGIVPYAFTGVPQLHSFVTTAAGDALIPEIPNRIRDWGALMRDPGSVDARERDAVLAELGAAGAQYQDILFYGPEADRQKLAARGFTTDFLSDNLWIARYAGCPAHAEVMLPAAVRHPLVVELGWAPHDSPVHRAIVQREANGQLSSVVMRPRRRFAGGLVVTVPPDERRILLDWRDAPCGAVWLRAGDATGDAAEWSASGPRCAGSGADGRLVGRFDDAHRDLACRLGAQ